METNCYKPHAPIECASSNSIGTLEFWNGNFTFLRIDFGIKQFGMFDGYKRKQRSSEDTRVVLRKR